MFGFLRFAAGHLIPDKPADNSADEQYDADNDADDLERKIPSLLGFLLVLGRTLVVGILGDFFAIKPLPGRRPHPRTDHRAAVTHHRPARTDAGTGNVRTRFLSGQAGRQDILEVL